MEREAGGNNTRQSPGALGSAASCLLFAIWWAADQQTVSIHTGRYILILIGVGSGGVNRAISALATPGALLVLIWRGGDIIPIPHPAPCHTKYYFKMLNPQTRSRFRS